MQGVRCGAVAVGFAVCRVHVRRVLTSRSQTCMSHCSSTHAHTGSLARGAAPLHAPEARRRCMLVMTAPRVQLPACASVLDSYSAPRAVDMPLSSWAIEALSPAAWADADEEPTPPPKRRRSSTTEIGRGTTRSTSATSPRRSSSSLARPFGSAASASTRASGGGRAPRPARAAPASSTAAGSGRVKLKRSQSAMDARTLFTPPLSIHPSIYLSSYDVFEEVADPAAARAAASMPQHTASWPTAIPARAGLNQPDASFDHDVAVVLIRPSFLRDQPLRTRHQVARLVDWINEFVGGLPTSPARDGRPRILREDELLYVMVSTGRRKEVCAAALVKRIQHAWRIEPRRGTSALIDDLRRHKGTDDISTQNFRSASVTSHTDDLALSSQLSDAMTMTQPLDEEIEFDSYTQPSTANASAPNTNHNAPSPRTVTDFRSPTVSKASEASPPPKRQRLSSSARSTADDSPSPLLDTPATTSQTSPLPVADDRTPSSPPSSPRRLLPASLGVEKIVVATKFRRRGLATRIIDIIRSAEAA